MRTQQEINEEYTRCVIQYGDKTFRMKEAQKEIEALEHRMKELVAEKPSPALVDSSEAQ